MQANVSREDASIASTLVMFCQFFGGAIFSSIAKTIFTASIQPAVEKFAPEIDPTLLINSGATELGAIASASQLPGVLLAYNQAIQHVFVSNECKSSRGCMELTTYSISSSQHRVVLWLPAVALVGET